MIESNYPGIFYSSLTLSSGITLLKKVDYARLGSGVKMSDDPCHSAMWGCENEIDIDATLGQWPFVFYKSSGYPRHEYRYDVKKREAGIFELYFAEAASMDSSTFLLRRKRKVSIPLWLVSNKAQQQFLAIKKDEIDDISHAYLLRYASSSTPDVILI
jgi:hypothetical protein